MGRRENCCSCVGCAGVNNLGLATNKEFKYANSLRTRSVSVLVGAMSLASAQSLPNYGPNAPATGDSYGKPYSAIVHLAEDVTHLNGRLLRLLGERLDLGRNHAGARQAGATRCGRRRRSASGS